MIGNTDVETGLRRDAARRRTQTQRPGVDVVEARHVDADAEIRADHGTRQEVVFEGQEVRHHAETADVDATIRRDIVLKVPAMPLRKIERKLSRPMRAEKVLGVEFRGEAAIGRRAVRGNRHHRLAGDRKVVRAIVRVKVGRTGAHHPLALGRGHGRRSGEIRARDRCGNHGRGIRARSGGHRRSRAHDDRTVGILDKTEIGVREQRAQCLLRGHGADHGWRVLALNGLLLEENLDIRLHGKRIERRAERLRRDIERHGSIGYLRDGNTRSEGAEE